MHSEKVRWANLFRLNFIEIDRLEKMTFDLSESLSPPGDSTWLGYISTRSKNGDGPCVVYFDDIYVLRDDNLCECELNQDGACNGQDWLLFYPDWGRTDCPLS